MSVHELVASFREHFHPSPQRTEQEVIEIRNRLLDLVAHPTEPSQVETASGTVEKLPTCRN
jgi:hypothetical protein